MENSRDQNLDIRKQIDAYIKGNLGEEEIQKLWNEFAKDPELLETLELEVTVKAAIERNMPSSKAGANTDSSSSIKKLPSWTWHAAAAAVIALVALVQLFRVDTATQLNQYVVGQIDVGQFESADGIRDKDITITTADSLLNLGFQAVISGDDSRALQLFEEVINNYTEEPYGSKAYLNKGIILYNESDYEVAIDAFQEAANRVEDSRMITEKAYWYLGNALVNVGQLEEAQDAVYRAYQVDGVFRSPAFRLLKKLSKELGTSDYEELQPQKLD
jgi:tetratricopeptide (TPR) repeat protein